MNAYIADSIAREHADRMMADAAAARRAQRAVRSRRAAASGRRRTSRSAQVVIRPVTAFRAWLFAGQL